MVLAVKSHGRNSVGRGGGEARGPNASPVIMANTQNVSVTKIVDTSSIQCAESKYGLRIQFLALIVMIHEV
jgi:hypothetical protein